MRPSRWPKALAAGSLAATAAVAGWGFSVDPGRPGRWILLGTVLPAFWLYVERAQVRGGKAEVGAAIMVFHRYVFAFAGLLLAWRVGIRLAVHEALLDPSWLSTGRRVGGLAVGVGMILFGNHLPTLRSPWPFAQQPFAWQRVHRFVGWTFVLSGVGVVGSWIALPPDAAARATVPIVLTASALAFVRKLASLTARAFGHR